jgi:hypothetical protein
MRSRAFTVVVLRWARHVFEPRSAETAVASMSQERPLRRASQFPPLPGLRLVTKRVIGSGQGGHRGTARRVRPAAPPDPVVPTRSAGHSSASAGRAAGGAASRDASGRLSPADAPKLPPLFDRGSPPARFFARAAHERARPNRTRGFEPSPGVLSSITSLDLGHVPAACESGFYCWCWRCCCCCCCCCCSGVRAQGASAPGSGGEVGVERTLRDGRKKLSRRSSSRLILTDTGFVGA